MLDVGCWMLVKPVRVCQPTKIQHPTSKILLSRHRLKADVGCWSDNQHPTSKIQHPSSIREVGAKGISGRQAGGDGGGGGVAGGMAVAAGADLLAGIAIDDKVVDHVV